MGYDQIRMFAFCVSKQCSSVPVSVHHMLDFCVTLGLRMTSISRDFISNNFFPHELFFFSSRKKEVLQYLMFSLIVI